MERAILVQHINRRNVVIFCRLLNQRVHGLLNGQILGYADEVGGHLAADLILIVGLNQLNVLPSILFHELDQLFLLIRLQGLQNVHGIVRIHAFQNVSGLIVPQLIQVFFRIFQIGEDFCRLILIQQGN